MTFDPLSSRDLIAHGAQVCCELKPALFTSGIVHVHDCETERESMPAIRTSVL